MHPYLPHLLSDIKAAHRSEVPKERTRKMSFEEQMEEIEKYTEADPPHTFGYYCGLESVNFPPQEQLTGKDMKQVCSAFEQMTLTWNFCIDLPKNLPTALRYSLLVEIIDEKTAIVNHGTIHLDFCTGYAPGCLLKEYCSCLKYWNNPPKDDMDQMPLNGSEDFPF